VTEPCVAEPGAGQGAAHRLPGGRLGCLRGNQVPWKDLDAYGEPDAPVRGRSAPPSGTLAYAYREGSSQV